MRIQRMSPQLANQIAAGEVIERPAQVIKELLENAFDAKATQVQIDLQSGGKQSMRVSDNGQGIIADDLPLAILAHATSKIRNLHDLEHVLSFGFRGEALACIASISEFTLISKPATQETAYSISQQGEQVEQKPAAHPNGTTVVVNHLFYNTPARRKFLRSDATEFDHILDVVKRAALSRFDIGMTLTHQNKVVLQLPPATTLIQIEARIKKIFGSGFLSNAVHLSTECEGMSLHGWISDARFTRNQSDLQYCYVNERCVRDRLISHAIRRAYDETLPPGRHACYILFLQCDPDAVDVNVHPTKHEVRFRQSRWVHDFLVQGVRQALVDPQQPISISAPVEIEYSSFETDFKEPTRQATLPILGWWQQRYCLLEENQHIQVLDVVRIIQADRMIRCIEAQPLEAKPILIPKRAVFSEKTMQWLLSQQPQWAQCAIEWTVLDETTVVLRAAPLALAQLNFADAVHDLMQLDDQSHLAWLACLAKNTEVDIASHDWWPVYQSVQTHPIASHYFRLHKQISAQDFLP